jgi:transglutaminase-like putative cysteine protease
VSAAADPRTTALLRWVLTAIVLTNLAFVHATEDAGLAWLLPMYAATLASPWLARLAGSAVWRWLWNGAVVATFAVLVRHTAVAGPRYLLEDGLCLAALCQVHVLCTLGERQKPDLLFFNSFLVAVVTAFLTQDVPYSLVFLVYAPLLVLGLSLYAAQRSRAPAAVARVALVHAGAALAVTAVVFLAWPRDFRRKGLVVESLALGPAAQSLDVGFTPEVRLGQRGDAKASDALVLRAKALSGDAADVPAYWRGATQLEFDGAGWHGGLSDRLGDPRWVVSGARALARSGPTGGVEAEVVLADPSGARVFLPLGATRVEFGASGSDDVPAALSDGTLRLSPAEAGHARDVEYRVDLPGRTPAPGGPVAWPAPRELEPALGRGPRESAEVVRLAESLRRELPADAPQHQIVAHFRAHLASRRDYMAPGAQDEAADMDAFVSGRAGGHCEHFATALALLLRHEGIPCRLVTGYMSDDWDERTSTLTIRRRDAHAWVEVKDPEAGWYTVDATPANARAARHEQSFTAALATWLSRTWESIVRLDEDARGRALAWIAALPRRAADLAAERPFACGAVLALVAALVAVDRRRRARRVPADVRAYRTCLRRLRLAPRPGETPRDLIARASVEGIAPTALARLEAATQRHESARYAAR